MCHFPTVVGFVFFGKTYGACFGTLVGSSCHDGLIWSPFKKLTTLTADTGDRPSAMLVPAQPWEDAVSSTNFGRWPALYRPHGTQVDLSDSRRSIASTYITAYRIPLFVLVGKSRLRWPSLGHPLGLWLLMGPKFCGDIRIRYKRVSVTRSFRAQSVDLSIFKRVLEADCP